MEAEEKQYKQSGDDDQRRSESVLLGAFDSEHRTQRTYQRPDQQYPPVFSRSVNSPIVVQFPDNVDSGRKIDSRTIESISEDSIVDSVCTPDESTEKYPFLSPGCFAGVS